MQNLVIQAELAIIAVGAPTVHSTNKSNSNNEKTNESVITFTILPPPPHLYIEIAKITKNALQRRSLPLQFFLSSTCRCRFRRSPSRPLDIDFDITKVGNQLLATVAKVGLNEQTKSFSEARLSQLAFNNQGSDLIADQGLSAALDATANRTERRTTTFGALSGGSSRYKTGSHSDVTGISLITGLAGNSRFALGKLTLGAFFEYGNANYDSYNSFTNAASVRGNGKTHTAALLRASHGNTSSTAKQTQAFTAIGCWTPRN